MMGMMIEAMERGWLPDSAIRLGIRRLCHDRLKSLKESDFEKYVENLKHSPIAVHTKEANEQHYEVPAEFFSLVLGKNKKYSSAYWSDDCRGLDDAEDLALSTTLARAEIVDGMKILELGCGWGSLTLAMAKKFPNSKIIALSNSIPQRESIEAEAGRLGLKNVTVLTRNIVEVKDLTSIYGEFDRIVSVEMFEHLRNYDALFQRIASWLKPEGKLFVHIFTHRKHSYFFETEGEDNWLGRYFFTGGQMPAQHLLARFQTHLKLEQQWEWDGTHYGRTSEAWLQNQDRNAEKIMGIFRGVYGKDAARWFQRWRVFFMSCAELFNYRQGSEWGVSHYLFSKKGLKS